VLTTTLRKVGGSVMSTVPPAILDLLHPRAGETVDGGRLVIEPTRTPRSSLDQLLAQCNPPWEAPTDHARRIRLFEVGGRYTLVDVAPTQVKNADGGRIAGWVYPRSAR